MSQLTANSIMSMAANALPHSSRFGCFLLRPPVPVIFKETGKVVEVEAVDIDGKYCNTVHVHELGFWRSPDQFKLKS